ncbi:hypothetical protein [Antrihabitans spumae]|uniref:Uncharacterized protein n=1 Tax=Antrihabitans spumae TaxID=3373370 RepID=A0ABW7KH86_9NOCA
MADNIGAVIFLSYGFDTSYLPTPYVVSRIVYLIVIAGLLIAMYRFLHR